MASATKQPEHPSQGWPQFVVMPESGQEEVHRGSCEMEFQRNTAKHLAKKLGKPALVFVAVERWTPDGNWEPI